MNKRSPTRMDWTIDNKWKNNNNNRTDIIAIDHRFEFNCNSLWILHILVFIPCYGRRCLHVGTATQYNKRMKWFEQYFIVFLLFIFIFLGLSKFLWFSIRSLVVASLHDIQSFDPNSLKHKLNVMCVFRTNNNNRIPHIHTHPE